MFFLAALRLLDWCYRGERDFARLHWISGLLGENLGIRFAFRDKEADQDIRFLTSLPYGRIPIERAHPVFRAAEDEAMVAFRCVAVAVLLAGVRCAIAAPSAVGTHDVSRRLRSGMTSHCSCGCGPLLLEIGMGDYCCRPFLVLYSSRTSSAVPRRFSSGSQVSSADE